jgi:hypothetical protein
MEEEPDLNEVPAPAASREAPSTAPVETNYKTRVSGKALCSMCMGAFPETVLTVIEGKPYCPDCSPLIGQRREPEVQEEGAPEVQSDYSTSMPSLQFREEKTGGGSRGILAIVLLVVLGGGGFLAFTMLGGDRIDALMSGLDTGRTDAYMLDQKYIPGESFDYSASGNLTAEGKISGVAGMFLGGGGGEFGADMKIFTGVGVEALAVDEQGNADLRVTTRNVDLDGEIRFGDKVMPLGALGMGAVNQMSGQSTRMKVDPFGDPIGQPSGEGMPDMFSGQMGDVPRHHLKVGDTWSANLPFDQGAARGIPGGMSLSNLSFGVRYRVEGFKRMLGRDCMVISLAGQLDGGDSISLPMMTEMKCDLDMKGVIFFDVSEGRLVKIAVDMNIDFGASANEGGIDLKAHLELDVDLK